jgi:hypothetical protein
MKSETSNDKPLINCQSKMNPVPTDISFKHNLAGTALILVTGFYKKASDEANN